MTDPVINPLDVTTFPQLVRAAAATFGDAPAVVLEEEGQPDEVVSFVDLDRRSADMAKGLLARGVGKGTRVGFIAGNGPLFAIFFGAIARIGAVAVPISTLVKANELVRILRQSDISGLLVQRSFLGKDYVTRLCEALPGLADAAAPDLWFAQAPYLRWILSSGPDLPSAIGDIASLADTGQGIGDDFLREVEGEVHPADQMVEIYTSGSQALPKGVRHLHGPVMARSRYIARMTGREPGQVQRAQLPMFWVGGLGMYLLADWAAGATTLCTERTMSNNRFAMGTVMADDDLKLMASSRPFWGLGMTETFGPYSYGDTLRLPGYPLCAPMDHVAEGYEMRVVDEAGVPVGVGGTGEIQVRGYALTPGIHKTEREGYFTADGFYRTGDQGLLEDNRVIFVGRLGDIIKTASSNVSPAEVEMELQQLDGVQNAYVVGLPDQERGQMVVAAIIARENAAVDTALLDKELRARLSGFKVPRAYVVLHAADVPMLPSNKVSRRDLTAQLAERLGR